MAGLLSGSLYRYPFENIDEQTKRAVWNKGKIVPDRPERKALATG